MYVFLAFLFQIPNDELDDEMEAIPKLPMLSFQAKTSPLLNECRPMPPRTRLVTMLTEHHVSVLMTRHHYHHHRDNRLTTTKTTTRMSCAKDNIRRMTMLVPGWKFTSYRTATLFANETLT